VPTVAGPIGSLSTEERVAAIREAVAALRDGGLVVFPTETVYGIGASARSPAAIASLRALARRDDAAPLIWHAPATDAVTDVLPADDLAQRRLLRRLWPGPVTFVFERDPAALARARGALGVPEGVLDDRTHLPVRVPDHEVAADLLRRLEEPLVAVGLSALGWGTGAAADDAVEQDRAATAGVAVVLDDGPARLGRPSTTVAFPDAGGYRVLAEHALPARSIERAARVVLLFVCSGNTCRSPMARAIADTLLAARPDRGLLTEARCAGVGAGNGAPPTPEAVEAIEQLGLGDLGDHRSQPLSTELIADADAIYCMTRAHLDAVVRLDPTAADRTHLLDPEGGDVDDPIGGGLDVYVDTARRMRDMIARRLQEIDP